MHIFKIRTLYYNIILQDYSKLITHYSMPGLSGHQILSHIHVTISFLENIIICETLYVYVPKKKKILAKSNKTGVQEMNLSSD